MNNLHLSEEAQNDLMEIKAYIEEEAREVVDYIEQRKS